MISSRRWRGTKGGGFPLKRSCSRCDGLGTQRHRGPALLRGGLGERLLAGAVEVPAQRAHGQSVGARGAAEAEVDAIGVQRGQGAELLGDNQRRMVGQHHAARADTDG